MTEHETSSSMLCCSCCRLSARKRQLPEIDTSRLFQPSKDENSAERSVQVPQIVISHTSGTGSPVTSTANAYCNDGLETSRSELFTTARTSRVEDVARYASMADLVHKIRVEAGFTDTPREESVTELRIEGLPELHQNYETPLPLPFRSELYPIQELHEESMSVHSQVDEGGISPAGQVLSDSVNVPLPSPSAPVPFRPSINGRIAAVTVKAYNSFWNVYYLVMSSIAMILERILPL